MPNPILLIILLVTVNLLTACSTGFHGSYAASTYVSNKNEKSILKLGHVHSQSCQTKFLYFFPIGDAPSTAKAVQSAKQQYKTTSHITDISIDNHTQWKIGYSKQCISVQGIAYQ